jgi:hypothetical protein
MSGRSQAMFPALFVNCIGLIGLFVSTSAQAQIFIDNTSELEAIQNNLSGNYILGGNINALGSDFNSIGSAANPFTGTLNGNGHTISNLDINSTATYANPYAAYVGLFAYNTGTIENVGLTNLTVTASQGYDVGGLAGRNGGNILNSYTTGSVSGNAGPAPGVGVAVGGIAGYSYGTVTNSYSLANIATPSTGVPYSIGGVAGINFGLIAQSHAGGAVSAPGNNGLFEANVGGLVGDNGDYYYGPHASIQQSSATGSVTAGPNSNVGGLAGLNYGGLTLNSYAQGAVHGGDGSLVGGLVGNNYHGNIQSSYSVGKVSGSPPSSLVGGLTAYPIGTVGNAYWDVQSSGQSTSGGGTPLTTAQLQSGTLPAGFDSGVWGDSKGSYPTLVSSLPMIAVTATPTGAYSLSGDPTVMEVTARPTNGLALQQVSSELGYPLGLDWVQKIINLPDPSGLYECDSVLCLTQTHLTSGSVPFNDPPLNGYFEGFTYDDVKYTLATNYEYPFYYSPATLGDGLPDGQSIETSNSLLLYDSPANNCLPGGSGVSCGGQTASSGALKFEDYLVGIVPCDTPGVDECNSNGFTVSNPISFLYDGAVVDSVEWTDSFNGFESCMPATPSSTTITLTTCGEGGVALSNLEPADALSGSGGVVALPPSVPEPSAFTMMLLGFSGLVFLAYFRPGRQLRAVS